MKGFETTNRSFQVLLRFISNGHILAFHNISDHSILRTISFQKRAPMILPRSETMLGYLPAQPESPIPRDAIAPRSNPRLAKNPTQVLKPHLYRSKSPVSSSGP